MEQEKVSGLDRFFQNCLVYKKECMAGVMSLLVVGVAVIAFSSSGPSYTDFQRTQTAFARWESNPTDTALFSHLVEALKNTTDLHQKYDALIAQKWIEAGDYDRAIPYAQSGIKKLQAECPLHASFAETTLLIGRGLYQEALEKAMGLKELLGDDPQLYTHNLIRIACLQRHLENTPGEIAAWKDLQEFAKGSEEVQKSVLAQYQDKNLDLTHYISERKAALGF